MSNLRDDAVREAERTQVFLTLVSLAYEMARMGCSKPVEVITSNGAKRKDRCDECLSCRAVAAHEEAIKERDHHD